MASISAAVGLCPIRYRKPRRPGAALTKVGGLVVVVCVAELLLLDWVVAVLGALVVAGALVVVVVAGALVVVVVAGALVVVVPGALVVVVPGAPVVVVPGALLMSGAVVLDWLEPYWDAALPPRVGAAARAVAPVLTGEVRRPARAAAGCPGVHLAALLDAAPAVEEVEEVDDVPGVDGAAAAERLRDEAPATVSSTVKASACGPTERPR